MTPRVVVVADHGDLAATRAAAPTPGAQAATARDAVVAELERCDSVLAAWEAGSAAFGRADATSDVDVCVICRDGEAAAVIERMEAALLRVEPDLHVWDHPTSPFGVQRFWQPTGDPAAAAICMVDTAVMQRDADRASYVDFLTPERHGRALPLLDRDGLLADTMRAAAFDPDAHRTKLAAELERIRQRHGIVRSFGTKELDRGRTLDAHWIHNSMVVGHLATLLGMVHRPLRYDFGPRYLHDELPADVAECLVPIVWPDTVRLRDAITEGFGWIDELLAGIDPDALPIERHAADMRAAFG